jgi:allantoate deiminase
MAVESQKAGLAAALAAVSAERIAKRVAELASIGGLANGGVGRLGLTASEQEARDRVAGWLQPLGYRARRDDACNLFCVRGEPPRVLVGSHLDSVPDGGRYDGALGVVAAVEMAEAADAGGLALPLEVVGWADEEGARFGTGLFGSGMAFGCLPASAWERRDRDGVSVRDAAAAVLGRAAGAASCRRDLKDFRAYVELHIEQGPILVQRQRRVGIVSRIVGLTHASVVITGRADHAGTTPMDARADALAAAAESVLAVERLAQQTAGEVVGTVGEIAVKPGAKNVVPGACTFAVDIRSESDAARQRVVGQARAAVEAICSRRGVRPTFDFYNDVPAAAMSPQVVAGLERAAALLELDPLHLSSGAGHDAQNAATAGVPTGMIFVRSSGGSHNPSEHAESSDAAAGTRLLLATVAALSGA